MCSQETREKQKGRRVGIRSLPRKMWAVYLYLHCFSCWPVWKSSHPIHSSFKLEQTPEREGFHPNYPRPAMSTWCPIYKSTFPSIVSTKILSYLHVYPCIFSRFLHRGRGNCVSCTIWSLLTGPPEAVVEGNGEKCLGGWRSYS